MPIKKFDKQFIQLPQFMKQWDRTGLTDEDFRALEIEVGTNYNAHDIIQGTGGLRKVRVGKENRGKSGGFRVLYLPLDENTIFLFITMFDKSDQANLSKAERNIIKRKVEQLKQQHHLKKEK